MSKARNAGGDRLERLAADLFTVRAFNGRTPEHVASECIAAAKAFYAAWDAGLGTPAGTIVSPLNAPLCPEG